MLGCASQSPVNSNSDKLPNSAIVSENQGQMLPIGARAKMGDQIIELEIAATPEQQMLGLMYRDSLPNNRGMLFTFEETRHARFWMKNVKINLDMVFLKDGEIVAIFSEVPPCSKEPCSTYGPNTPINQVIELRGGRAAELGLKKGDRVDIEILK